VASLYIIVAEGNRFVYNWCGGRPDLYIIGAEGNRFVYNWCGGDQICI
jgi:hypothetical protein